MLVGSGLALALRPTNAVPEGAVDLERMIPKQFGSWKELPSGFLQMALTPRDGETTTDSPYDQTLMRTYVKDDGTVVMVALAYGRRLRQEVKIHRPELCYVAQGFAIQPKKAVQLHLSGGHTVPAYRLITGNSSRTEPVTYWIRVGRLISGNAWQTRLAIFQDGLRGNIPDGILVRVSQALPREADANASYAIEERFLSDLLGSVSADTRKLLVGP